MIQLPLTNDPASRVTVNTGSGTYTFVTYYMPHGAWLMDIRTSQGELLLAGLALVPGIDNLLKGHGDLFANVRMQVECDPGTANDTPDSLGNTARVLWFTSEETGLITYPDPMLVD